MSGQGGSVKVVYIKKKAKHAGHHGGAWKVAYADFVTAMMALFIVLWLLTQTDTASRERIAQYFRTGTLPGGTMVHGHTAGSNPPVAIDIFPVAPPAPHKVQKEADAKALKQLAEATQGVVIEGEHKDGSNSEELADHVTAKIVDEGALIELVDGGDNFLFSVSSSSLKRGAIALLERLTPLLLSVPNKIEIHGHTDARRFDPHAPQDNWDLSFQRANQAREVLESHGIPSNRISAVVAHADSSPYNASNPYAPENRRLAILVVREGYEAERQGQGKNLPMLVDPNAAAGKAIELPQLDRPVGITPAEPAKAAPQKNAQPAGDDAHPPAHDTPPTLPKHGESTGADPHPQTAPQPQAPAAADSKHEADASSPASTKSADPGTASTHSKAKKTAPRTGAHSRRKGNAMPARLAAAIHGAATPATSPPKATSPKTTDKAAHP